MVDPEQAPARVGDGGVLSPHLGWVDGIRTHAFGMCAEKGRVAYVAAWKFGLVSGG